MKYIKNFCLEILNKVKEHIAAVIAVILLGIAQVPQLGGKNVVFELKTPKGFTTFFSKNSLQAADFSAGSGQAACQHVWLLLQDRICEPNRLLLFSVLPANA